MSYLGKLLNRRGKQFRVFTNKEEAKQYVDTHDKGKYTYKELTVYGVYLIGRKR